MLEVKFDSAGNLEQPTLVLAYKNGDKKGVLSDPKSLVVTSSFGNPIQLSFTAFQQLCPQFYDQIRDFRSIWVPEWDRWFEMRVEVSESSAVSKFVTATHLPEAELSQLMIFSTEINTVDDIDTRDENYEGTIFYDELNPETSLLHRVTQKAVNFKITHVDKSLMKIWRQFSFDGTSIHDALLEIAEEVHCLFIFGTEYDKETKKLWRTISAYDLENSCLNENCKYYVDNGSYYRHETETTCPHCGKPMEQAFGTDTGIFLSTENALDEVTYSSNVDSVKNCFKLEGGDLSMTAAIMMCNPSGSDYIWVFSETMREDMSEELQNALDEYERLLEEYTSLAEYGTDEYPLNITEYNELVSLYEQKPYENSIKPATLPLVGHSALMELYYDTIDMDEYLNNGLMPIPKMEDTTPENEIEKLKAMTTVAVKSSAGVSSTTTVQDAVKSLAEAIADPRYDIEIVTTSLDITEVDEEEHAVEALWSGIVTVINEADEELTDSITFSEDTAIIVNTDYKTFTEQRIDKALAKGEDVDYSISGIFKLDNDAFEEEMQKYSLTSLKRYKDSCNEALKILYEQGAGNPGNFEITDPDNNLYNKLYVPYTSKLTVIEETIALREKQIEIINTLQDEINDVRAKVSELLNLEKFLYNYADHEDVILWSELNLYRREDKYSNSNYIADETDNATKFKDARLFLDGAMKEIKKAATLQHSISVSLKNIFTINEFKPLRNGFSVGNWLRIKADGKVHKLRLLSYELDYENYQNITVEFSDVEKVHNEINDMKSTIENIQSISTSFDYVERQADKGADSATTVRSFIDDGLDMTYTKIINSATGQTQTWDSNGMLFRSVDDISGEYSPEQMKIVNSTIVITDNNWNSVKTAVGRFIYYDPISKTYKEGYGVNGEVLVGKVIIGETLTMSNPSGSLLFNENGFTVKTGETERLKIDPEGKVKINANEFVINSDDTFIVHSDNFTVDEDGNVTIAGKISASEGDIAEFTIKDTYLYSGGTGLSSNANRYAFWAGETNNKYGVVGDNGSNAKFSVTHEGKLYANDANITGTITADALTAIESGTLSIFSFDNYGMWVDFNNDNTLDYVFSKSSFSATIYNEKNIQRAYFYMDTEDSIHGINGRAIIFGNDEVSIRTNGSIYFVNERNTMPVVEIDFSGNLTTSGNIVSEQELYEYSVPISTLYASIDHKHTYFLNSNNYRIVLNDNNNLIPSVTFVTGDTNSESHGDIDLGSNLNYFGDVNYSGSLDKRSDKRLKNDLGNLDYNDAKLLITGLNIKKFTYYDDPMKKIHYGIYAQDLRDLLINTGIGYSAVLSIYDIQLDKKSKDLYLNEKNASYGVDYTLLISPHIKVTQQHEKDINSLMMSDIIKNERISELENKIAHLEQQLAVLTA